VLGWRPRPPLCRGLIRFHGARRGGGVAPRAPACASMCTDSGFVSIGTTGGSRGAFRVSTCAVTSAVSGRLPSEPPVGPVGRYLPGVVPPALGRPSWRAPPPADGRAYRGPRRGGQRGRAGFGGRPGCTVAPGGPAGRKRCTFSLRSILPGRIPRGSVSVWRWAVMSWAPGSAPRGASGNGGASAGWGAAGASAPLTSLVSPEIRPTCAIWGAADCAGRPFHLCGGPMEIFSDHAVSCKKSGFGDRHLGTQSFLCQVLTQARVPHDREVDVAGNGRRPADILLKAWDGRRGLEVDLTIVQPNPATGRPLRGSAATFVKDERRSGRAPTPVAE